MEKFIITPKEDSSGSVQQLIAKDEPLAQRAHQSGSAIRAQSYGGKRQQIIYIAKRAALPLPCDRLLIFYYA